MSNNPATVIRFKCRCVLICVEIYIWDPFLPTKPLQTRTEEKTNKEIDHFKSQNVFGRKLLAVLIEEPICHTKAETIGFLGFWYCFIYCNQAVLKEQGLTEMKNSFELLNCAFMCQDCFFFKEFIYLELYYTFWFANAASKMGKTTMSTRCVPLLVITASGNCLKAKMLISRWLCLLWKDNFTQKWKWNQSHPHVDGKSGEVCSPQNISRASRQNITAAFS